MRGRSVTPTRAWRREFPDSGCHKSVPSMRAFEFNVSGTNQHMYIGNADSGLNPPDCMTVEALCEFLGNGQEPTVFGLPANERWEPPFIAWRLGCHGQELHS